ncbi:MAG: hypothetical protein K0Q79_2248 [Flavipsychrobacter sp.]|jgi:hypothetical protein|nr:hypothetical protein [Flavipsychrobacter sp.]
MRVLLFFFISLFSFASEGRQLSSGYRDSVKSFFKSWVENQYDFVFTVMDNTTLPGLIHYEFTMDTADIRAFKSPFTVRKIVSEKKYFRIEYGKDSINLTQNEVNYDIDKISASGSFRWTKDFFPNAEIVDSTRYFNELMNSIGSRSRPAFWTISLPVFLRNGEYCVLFSLYYCGSMCGHSELSVYKYESGLWQKFSVLRWSLY